MLRAVYSRTNFDIVEILGKEIIFPSLYTDQLQYGNTRCVYLM
jgi:hypothetical protein